MKFVKLNKEEADLYQVFYKKHNVIGLIDFGNYSKVVLKMKRGFKGFTPYMTARDCGDHYILAMYDRYDRLDKKTWKLTTDVEDR